MAAAHIRKLDTADLAQRLIRDPRPRTRQIRDKAHLAARNVAGELIGTPLKTARPIRENHRAISGRLRRVRRNPSVRAIPRIVKVAVGEQTCYGAIDAPCLGPFGGCLCRPRAAAAATHPARLEGKGKVPVIGPVKTTIKSAGLTLTPPPAYREFPCVGDRYLPELKDDRPYDMVGATPVYVSDLVDYDIYPII